MVTAPEVERGHLAQAQAAYAESLTLCRRLDDQAGVARALHNLGNLAVTQGHYREAVQAYDRLACRWIQGGPYSYGPRPGKWHDAYHSIELVG